LSTERHTLRRPPPRGSCFIHYGSGLSTESLRSLQVVQGILLVSSITARG